MSRRTAPCFSIRVSKPGATADSAERLDVRAKITSLTYEDDEKKPDKLTLVVDNFDLKQFEQSTWRKGNLLHVSWGYPGAMAPERECTIKKTKGGPQLSVEAEGKESIMDRRYKIRHFENMTRSQVVKQIAEEYGFGVDRQDIEDSKVIYPQITQARLTDYQFCRDLSRRERFEFFADFDGLHFHRRLIGQKPLRRFEYYTDPGRGDILSWNIENEVDQTKPGSVTAQTRTPLDKEDVSETANDATVPRDGLAPVPEIFGKTEANDSTPAKPTEQETIDEATGEARIEQIATNLIVPSTQKTREAVQREAHGLYTAAQINAVQLTLVCIGDANIVAKSTIEVTGLGSVISGLYYVSSVKHEVTDQYKMTIKCKRDGHARGTGTGTKTDDPQSKANQNTKTPTPEGELEQIQKIDPVTGQATTIYADARGREKADKSDFAARVEYQKKKAEEEAALAKKEARGIGQ